jgi:hypothetical protein
MKHKPISISEMITQLRTVHGMTPEEICADVGCSRMSVYLWEVRLKQKPKGVYREGLEKLYSRMIGIQTKAAAQ